MLYAKVAVGLPVDGPFDYAVPQELRGGLRAGSRVWVNFAHRKIIGYVVGFSKKTRITGVKPILEAIDGQPLLNDNLLRLTRELSGYYCCSWGEAIETAIPRLLRNGKKIPVAETPSRDNKDSKEINTTLVHNPDFQSRWEVYLRHIKKTIDNKRSVIILLPDIHSLMEAKSIVSKRLAVTPHLLYRKEAGEIKEWCAVRQGGPLVVMGVRSAIFAPVENLGLVIIDEEQNFVYKQDQVPHYNAREVCFMRAGIDQPELLLGSGSPSAEMVYLVEKKRINYIGAKDSTDFPRITIVNSRSYANFGKKQRMIFSKLLEDAIYSSINAKEKILLFLNRKGFATSATCLSCGFTLKCQRCNINLTYHYKEGFLSCRYCNYRMGAPMICPECNAGYIRYSGAGTEKIESQLSTMFPSAVIKRIERVEALNLGDADIFVATSAITKGSGASFDLVGVLSIDSSLNHPDLRSSEKAFAILSNLSALTGKKMIIQTAIPEHHCFQALLKKDPHIFYDEELKQRKELSFPPYRHLILVKLRGANEEKVKTAAESLFEKLNKAKKTKGIRILSLNPGAPPKLRDNFYRQILVSCGNVQGANKFLKSNLKSFSRSGIIVTVDVDPL